MLEAVTPQSFDVEGILIAKRFLMNNYTRFYLFLISAVVMLAVNAIIHFLGGMPQAFSYSVFYILLLTCAILFVAYYQEIGLIFFKNIKVFFACVVVSVSIGLSVGYDFRVLADETNLLSTSHGLLIQKQLVNITEQFFYYDNYHPLTVEIAHRPAFFSFVTSLVNHVIGFNWFNGFIVIFLVSVFTLWAAYLFFHQYFDRFLATAVASIFASFPIFQLNVTSSGFDALNMLMIGLVYIQIFRFLVKPSGAAFELLCLLSLLAAQVRYETVVLAVPLIVLIAFKLRLLASLNYSIYFPILPLLALPVIWQKLITSTFANPGDKLETVFSLSFMLENWSAMFRYLAIGQNEGQPVLGVVFFLAVIGIVLFFYDAFKKQKLTSVPMQAFYLCLLAQILLSSLQFAYYFGNYQLAWINRLSQLQLLWIAPFSAYAIYRVVGVSRFPTRYPVIILVSAVLFMMGNTVAQLNPSGKSLSLFKEFKFARSYLQEHLDPRSTLVISERSGMYAALGYSAVKPSTAIVMREALRQNLEAGLYQTAVIVAPRKIHGSEKHELEEYFSATELARFQTLADEYVAIVQIAN